MPTYELITKEELGKGSTILLQILDSEYDVYHEMARIMFDKIRDNNAKGKNTVLICPVGPIGQYKRFASMVNKYRLSLKNVYIFNMDEYLDNNKQLISINHPLSFSSAMERELYSKVDDKLNVPIENRFFPQPGKEELIWDKMCTLGGVDLCLGGIGINGHVAFNEPPEPDEKISDEEFKNLSTRILKISRETKTVNAIMAAGGYIDIIPDWCITLGMNEILNSKKIVIGMFRDWQKGIIRKILHGPVTMSVPASFLQLHIDAKIIMTVNVAERPI